MREDVARLKRRLDRYQQRIHQLEDLLEQYQQGENMPPQPQQQKQRSAGAMTEPDPTPRPVQLTRRSLRPPALPQSHEADEAGHPPDTLDVFAPQLDLLDPPRLLRGQQARHSTAQDPDAEALELAVFEEEEPATEPVRYFLFHVCACGC